MKPEKERIQPKPFRHKSNFWRIGHRGFAAKAPENTMISFQKAHEAGVDMIEFDVTYSKDRIPIVLHDRTLNRTTDGKGKPQAKTLRALKSLDAGKWFSKEFRGEEIPTLSQVLSWARGKVALNIEIKSEASSFRAKHGIEENVVELISDYEMEEHVVVSSFSQTVVKRVKSKNPKLSVALLVARLPVTTKIRSVLDKLKVDALHINKESVTPELIKKLKEGHYPVRAYTVNDLSTMKKLIDFGVDGLFSDDPTLFNAV